MVFGGSIPQNYDKGLGPVFFEPYALDMAARVAKLKPQHVLETAAGTGRVTAHLYRTLNAAATLVATDINPDMLQVAKEKVTAPGIRWEQADAIQLPFEDNRFDVVTTSYGIMFYPDKRKGMQEAHRVLKPGGTFIFNVWDKIERNPMAKTVREIVAEFFENDPPAFYNIPFGYNNPAEITALLKDVGFTNVTFEVLEKPCIAPSAETMAVGLVEGNPISTAIRERDPEAVNTIREKVFRALVEKFGDSPSKTTMQAIVFSGVK